MVSQDLEDTNKSASERRARRKFLAQSAFLTAASCAAPILGVAKELTSSVPVGCTDLNTPMKEVAGKVAFVTGGSSGIGLGIARACADAGMKVVVGYRTKEHLDEAMQYFGRTKDRIHAINVDVTDRVGMKRAAAESVEVFGKVHVLVNNAGVQNPTVLSQISYDEWDRLMAVNVTGVLVGVQAFLPHLQEHGEGGQIVSVASISGLLADGPGYGAYCTSKFAVVGMMEALRVELAKANIGVSVCCPGVVKSNLEKGLKDWSVASDPYEVGGLVIKGIRSNALYILTHPEFGSFIEARCRTLVASVPHDVHTNQARTEFAHSLLANSIYISELNRIRCVDGAHT